MEEIYRKMTLAGLTQALVCLEEALSRSWQVDTHERKEYVDDINADVELVRTIIKEREDSEKE